MPRIGDPGRLPHRPPTTAEETFLFYVAVDSIGLPIHGTSFFCPWCNEGGEANPDWASFSIRPPLGNYAVKFKCHRCQVWGDEIDLVQFVHKLSHDMARIHLSELLRLWMRDRRMDLRNFNGYSPGWYAKYDEEQARLRAEREQQKSTKRTPLGEPTTREGGNNSDNVDGDTRPTGSANAPNMKRRRKRRPPNFESKEGKQYLSGIGWVSDGYEDDRLPHEKPRRKKYKMTPRERGLE